MLVSIYIHDPENMYLINMGSAVVKVLLGAVLSVFVLGILLGNFIDVIDDMRVGNSLDFNNTMDDVETFSWLAAGFMALGILIWAGRYIMALIQGM